MDDTKQPEKKDKKLSLTVRNLETLEVRASPNTVCPVNTSTSCCKGSQPMWAAKLTAVAYF